MKSRIYIGDGQGRITTYMEHYDTICDQKQGASVQVLTSIRNEISVKYIEYIEKIDNGRLVELQSVFNSRHNEKQSLLSSYTGTKCISEIKTDVFGSNGSLLGQYCPYCDLGRATTIDHYVPKESYPDFAILCCNFLPCCNKCNSKKQQYWKDIVNGVEILAIINPYIHNEIDSISFLKLNLNNEYGILSGYFELNIPNGVSDEIRNVITLHYRRLDIIYRLNNEINSELSEIIRSLDVIYPNEISEQDLADFLTRDAISLEAIYGTTFWKALIRRELADNINLLN